MPLTPLCGKSATKSLLWTQKSLFGGIDGYLPLQKIFLAEKLWRIWEVPYPPPFFLGKSVKLYLKGSLYVRLKCVNAVKAVTVVLAQLQKREEKKIVAVAHLRRKKGVALASREKHASPKKIKKNPLTCNLQGQLATPEGKNSSVKKQRTKR